MARSKVRARPQAPARGDSRRETWHGPAPGPQLADTAARSRAAPPQVRAGTDRPSRGRSVPEKGNWSRTYPGPIAKNSGTPSPLSHKWAAFPPFPLRPLDEPIVPELTAIERYSSSGTSSKRCVSEGLIKRRREPATMQSPLPAFAGVLASLAVAAAFAPPPALPARAAPRSQALPAPASLRASSEHHFFAEVRSGTRLQGTAGGQPGPSAPGTNSVLPKPAFSGVSPVGPSGPTLPLGEDLAFLEASPYWDQSGIPVNVAKQKDPFIGKIVSVQRIVGVNAPGEICNVVVDHGGDLPYWEGQSYGVLPPGIDPKKNKPYGVRLYSIASTRYGDDKSGKTTTLCVRRAVYVDPETGKEDPAKKGVCSNMLCDAKPGDAIKITGPSGKVLLMPEEKPDTTYIMVATGTGIAPFRGFMRRLFGEGNPRNKDFTGLAWLFLGVANTDSLLYDEEFQTYKQEYPDRVRLDYALSREQTNDKGGKLYIQVAVRVHRAFLCVCVRVCVCMYALAVRARARAHTHTHTHTH